MKAADAREQMIVQHTSTGKCYRLDLTDSSQYATATPVETFADGTCRLLWTDGPYGRQLADYVSIVLDNYQPWQPTAGQLALSF